LATVDRFCCSSFSFRYDKKGLWVEQYITTGHFSVSKVDLHTGLILMCFVMMMWTAQLPHQSTHFVCHFAYQHASVRSTF
jgi:hypothetical protein